MDRTRYLNLLGQPILSMRELDELADLMLQLDPERFNREVDAWDRERLPEWATS